MCKNAECEGCPFNYGSDKSDFAQNAGCLPTPKEIINIYNDTGKVWACHEKPEVKCKGFLLYSKKYEININPKAEIYTEEGTHY